MDETRARIMDAALEMYETVGPAATSISAVAARARVTRATLYRHFPTDADLANAVIDEWSAGSGSVDEAALAAIADPTARLRTALVRLYSGYRATEAMTANLLRDAHSLPAERQDDLRLSARRVRDAVGSASAGAGATRRGTPSATAKAAIGHAVTFETWRSLSGEGLDDAAIVDLMLILVNGSGDGSRGRSRDAQTARPQSTRARPAATPVAAQVSGASAAAPVVGAPAPTTEPGRPDAAPKKAKGGKGKRGKKGKAEGKGGGKGDGGGGRKGKGGSGGA
jgi:AcrR family transcriptional regulator